MIVSGRDVSQYVQKIEGLSEYNDEGAQFGGVFRRSNVQIALDNNSGIFDDLGEIFAGGRNRTPFQIFYIANNNRLNRFLIYDGVVDEGSTLNNLVSRTIELTLLDYLSLLDYEKVDEDAVKAIDNLYFRLRGSKDIRLNKHFIACFLYYFFSKNGNRLNKIMNVFRGGLRAGSYPTINAEIESIFPPSDQYYSSNNVSALQILITLCRSVNSYAIVENTPASSILYVKRRPRVGTPILINNRDIIAIENLTKGYNKLYNSISINNSEPYVRQSSLDKYGIRVLNVDSYAPPSQQLADSYLDYYGEPKTEFDCSLKMSHSTLSVRVGDIIQLNIQATRDKTVSGLDGIYAVLSREINFLSEIVSFRLRAV